MNIFLYCFYVSIIDLLFAFYSHYVSNKYYNGLNMFLIP